MRLAMLAASQKVGGMNTYADDDWRPNMTSNKLTENDEICTMGCPPVRGDNPRALASGLYYVQVDKHGITILYHLHQCRPSTS